MDKPFIENAFVVIENGSKVYTRKLHKSIEDAKRYCTMRGEYEKNTYLDGAEILHIVNDFIISSIDITSWGSGILYFSDVHLLSKKNPIL